MFGRRPKKSLSPGTYSHEASVIAHLGKIYLPAATIVASTVEAVYLVSDLIQDDSVGDELVAIGQYGLLGAASFALFNGLQHHYARRSEEIRSQHVTE